MQLIKALYPKLRIVARGMFSLSKCWEMKKRCAQGRSWRCFRLPTIAVRGHVLPATWTKKAGISKCRLFVSGENLLTFTSLFDVFDPETCTGGVGGNVYPLSSTWSFGLSLTF